MSGARGNLFLNIILPVSVVVLACTGIILWRDIRREQQEQATRNLIKAREQEAEAVRQQLAECQTTSDVMNVRMVLLTTYANCALTDSFVPQKASNNNMEELPTGKHVFSGIPFDVTGRIQLWGRGLASLRSRFPKQVEGITVSAKCTKIYLFHGALFANQPGMPIPSLVLHYQDGSRRDVQILVGQHVLDWWGPVYQKGVSTNAVTVTDPGSELAWVGSNPYIRARQPSLSVRLYKSPFENPLPAVQIATIDYVSSGGVPAPFLVGLTIE
jgi:hypothetical protein